MFFIVISIKWRELFIKFVSQTHPPPTKYIRTFTVFIHIPKATLIDSSLTRITHKNIILLLYMQGKFGGTDEKDQAALPTLTSIVNTVGQNHNYFKQACVSPELTASGHLYSPDIVNASSLNTSVSLIDDRISSLEKKLEKKLLARIRSFDFGAKDVEVMKVTWPVDFLPS